jgi:hypothetical protein
MASSIPSHAASAPGPRPANDDVLTGRPRATRGEKAVVVLRDVGGGARASGPMGLAGAGAGSRRAARRDL